MPRIAQKQLIVLLISVFLFFFFSKFILDYIKPSVSQDAYWLISGSRRFVGIAIVIYVLRNVTFLKMNKIFKFNIFVYLFCLFLIVVSLRFSLPFIGDKYSINTLLAYYFNCLSTGAFEEIFCRWIVFSYLVVVLSKVGMFKQILLASFIFAIFHILNFLSGHASFYSTINQIEIAFILGLLFQCLFIKFQNIILVILMHSLVNFHGMFNSTFNQQTEIIETGSEFWTSFVPTQVSMLILLAIMLPLTFLFTKTHENKLALIE